MDRRRPGRQVGLAGLLGVLAQLPVAPVDADRVRAAASGDHWVVLHRGELRRSLGGAPAEAVVLGQGAWAIDALPLADGAIWVVAGIPRGDRALLARVIPGTPIAWRAIPGADSVGELSFVPGAGAPLIVTARGAWAVGADGEARRTARWEVDGYGFYAASSRAGARGRLTVLAPEFNTCGSSDLLEGVVELRLAAGRVTRGRWREARLGYWAPVLGADGRVYTTRLIEPAEDEGDAAEDAPGAAAAGACRLESRRPGARAPDIVAGMAPAACRPALVAHDGRSTVVVFGDRVLRLESRRRRLVKVDLGPLPRGAEPADVFPDPRGRALVLLADGRLLRFGPSGVEELAGP